ncbi:Target of rapamycin complex subunit lst8 [Trichinella sp. T9]|nr:Target of rapamycin complex subunit lst8 [Trichinella sp. T9]
METNSQIGTSKQFWIILSFQPHSIGEICEQKKLLVFIYDPFCWVMSALVPPKKCSMAEKVSEKSILATGGYDHTIKLWKISPPVCFRTLQHPDSQVNKLELTADGTLLAAAGYQRIRMYDIATGDVSPVVNYEGVAKNITAVGFNNSTRWMYTGGEDNSARIWDLRSRNLQCQRIFQVNTPVSCVCLHPNQVELFVGDQSGTIHLWDLRTDHNEQLLPERNMMIQSVDVNGIGTMLGALTHKGMFYTWTLKSVFNKPSRIYPKMKLEAHKTYALRCKFSPNSEFVVTTSADHTAKMWKSSDLNEVITFTKPGQQWVWDCAFTSDSEFLFTCSSDSVVRLWRCDDGAPIHEYAGHQRAVTTIAFQDGCPKQDTETTAAACNSAPSTTDIAVVVDDGAKP